MMRGVLLVLFFYVATADLLHTRFPNSYTLSFTTSMGGQSINGTLVTDGMTTVSFSQFQGLELKAYQYNKNQTSYSTGVPGIDEKCVGLYMLPGDQNLDVLADFNQNAKFSGKCQTGRFSIGLLWTVPTRNGISTQLCTDLLANEPIWAKVNTTSNGQTVQSDLKFHSLSKNVDASLLVLPSECYLVVNSREHPLKKFTFWSALLRITRPKPEGGNETISATVVQDKDGRNVYIESSGNYDVTTQDRYVWTMYFPENKTWYSHTPGYDCYHARVESYVGDKTIFFVEAAADPRGIEAVYTGEPCKTMSDGFILGYWYNYNDGARTCVLVGGSEPISYVSKPFNNTVTVWEYVSIWEDDVVRTTVSFQLPEDCWKIQ